ncbi:omptin family outer membrane protease, partial [Desulfobulbus sp. F4]|nr:omptin family outer membrane protease [Desulfobulbus sp. F4]
MKPSDSGTATWILAGAMLLLSIPQQAAASEKSYLPSQLDLTLGMEAMTGDTSFSIGGNAVLADGSRISTLMPTSKLEWPLDIWLTRLDAALTFSPVWRINAAVKTNLGEPGDPITDRDWLSAPTQVDIYSESRVSSFDALIVDFDLEWTFLQQDLWSLYAGAGYQQQKFQ